MADAAPDTFNDLPDDILDEIFGCVFDESEEPTVSPTDPPPRGAHLALRSVCRRWRPVTDWARLASATVRVHVSKLADVDAARLHHPAAIKILTVRDPPAPNPSMTGVVHSTLLPRALVSLTGHNPDLWRSMSTLILTMCCSPLFQRIVTPIAACTALTELHLVWYRHPKQRQLPADALAPLSALPLLAELSMSDHALVSDEAATLIQSGPQTWPALPDAPRLTRLDISRSTNFVFVGSDAALGRLQALKLTQQSAADEAMAAEDPFFLRAAFDKETWKPHLLRG